MISPIRRRASDPGLTNDTLCITPERLRINNIVTVKGVLGSQPVLTPSNGARIQLARVSASVLPLMVPVVPFLPVGAQVQMVLPARTVAEPAAALTARTVLSPVRETPRQSLDVAVRTVAKGEPLSQPEQNKKKDRFDVVLHVYHVSRGQLIRLANGPLTLLGFGAYHAGIEIHGVEWSYGSEDGVHSIPEPTKHPDHQFRSSHKMRTTTKNREEVEDIIERLRLSWLADDYSVTRNNCSHFCDELCQELGVREMPRWVTRLADSAAELGA